MGESERAREKEMCAGERRARREGIRRNGRLMGQGIFYRMKYKIYPLFQSYLITTLVGWLG